ncbi:ABC transporter permease [Marinilactibacillus psychrotolerans]|uniref:Nitrate/sulfonate/bicarbonate ABC transporter permease protein n=1 Tax=Marinilactibacillus psychrotolerans TaxID=191770 RepID=A0AAV3WRP9_9LACT|nr:ABC transporter permease subunit [Marinilactibacillus psychrotolerans]GEL66467.1 ABC transporter permease [Marinilactibacillus psychrotolerans]GEQ35283.1 nitrate/sulfonate/bicarbonate ABC transporter permease protein [Marinilactibacillus psychrotolerans]SDC53959.1 NitT/TauT family transport system permease protein [Marinilactibacillus psychrotolerans]
MKRAQSNFFRSLFLGILSYLAVWILLYILSNNHAIPSPIVTGIKMWDIKELLGLHIIASSLRIFIALLLAVLVGLPIGILLSMFPKSDRLLSPLLYFLYPLPKVAFLPVFMLFWGLGNFSKILLLFSIIVLQVIILVRDGAKTIPENYQRIMTNFQASIWQQIRYLILPAIFPNILASLRVSIGIALASLFFAENYATDYGLGYLILSAWTKMDYPEMFAGIFCIALLGFILFRVIDSLERFSY